MQGAVLNQLRRPENLFRRNGGLDRKYPSGDAPLDRKSPSEPSSLVVSSPQPMPGVPEVAFHRYLLRKAKEHKDAIYLIEGDAPEGRRLTFSRVLELTLTVSRNVRRILRPTGRRGDDHEPPVVCIFASNCPEFLLTFLGLMQSGCVPVLVNPSLTWEELARHLADSGATFVFACSQSAQAATRAAGHVTHVQGVSVFGEDFETHFLSGPPEEEEVESLDLDSTAAMFFSSGTSGLPKCVELSHRGLLANLFQTTCHPDMLLYECGAVVLCVLPLAHAYASLALALPCLATGATVLLMRYDYHRALAAAELHGATTFPLVPPILTRMLQDEDVTTRYPRLGLRAVYSAAAPVSPQAEEQFCAKFHIQDYRQILGMTEMSPLVCSTPRGRHRPGSVGTLYAGTRMKVVRVTQEGADEEEELLGPGQVGELLFGGPHVMKGYLGNPSATAQVVDRDGFLRTGDMGYYDAEGFVYLVDRKKEIIRYKCTQVAPAELEALLMSHPSVLDAAVIGVPDSQAGELPRAYVVSKPGSGLTEKDVVEHVAAHSASFKHLRGGAILVPSIPRSTTGKILRRILRQQCTNHGR